MTKAKTPRAATKAAKVAKENKRTKANGGGLRKNVGFNLTCSATPAKSSRSSSIMLSALPSSTALPSSSPSYNVKGLSFEMWFTEIGF